VLVLLFISRIDDEIEVVLGISGVLAGLVVLWLLRGRGVPRWSWAYTMGAGVAGCVLAFASLIIALNFDEVVALDAGILIVLGIFASYGAIEGVFLASIASLLLYALRGPRHPAR
jgi:hypothetical protein